MSFEARIEKIIKQASKLEDQKLVRSFRKIVLESLQKQADFGVLQNYKGNIIDYETREHKVPDRSGDAQDRDEGLYGVSPTGYPENQKVDLSTREYSESLSTRYSPDRPGVQARRISDGIFQDPYTGKVYDWNEGFKTEDGQEYFGGSVPLQTEIHDRTSS